MRASRRIRLDVWVRDRTAGLPRDVSSTISVPCGGSNPRDRTAGLPLDVSRVASISSPVRQYRGVPCSDRTGYDSRGRGYSPYSSAWARASSSSVKAPFSASHSSTRNFPRPSKTCLFLGRVVAPPVGVVVGHLEDLLQGSGEVRVDLAIPRCHPDDVDFSLGLGGVLGFSCSAHMVNAPHPCGGFKGAVEPGAPGVSPWRRRQWSVRWGPLGMGLAASAGNSRNSLISPASRGRRAGRVIRAHVGAGRGFSTKVGRRRLRR